jgi:hypothetical protein
MQTYDISAKFVSYNSGALWQFFYHVDTDGFLLLRGEGARPISDGAAHPVKAVLLTPSSGPEPATWFCSTTGSVVSSDSVDTHVDLKNLGRLGTCAGGVAVSGEIKVCDSPGISGTCDFTRTGTLDGVSITQANWDGTGGTSLAEVSIGYPDGMIIRFTRLNSNGPTGALIDAFVITPDETIYCAGANSDHTVDTAGNLINTLRSFMRVGNCAGVTGANTAQGCLGAR